MEGLKFMKAQRPELALEHFTTAKSFNKNSSKIYIARGCALANMVESPLNRTIFPKASERFARPWDYLLITRRPINISRIFERRCDKSKVFRKRGSEAKRSELVTTLSLTVDNEKRYHKQNHKSSSSLLYRAVFITKGVSRTLLYLGD